ncbi:conserved hypothetical protein [Leishmania braziliensis MHOM/BR/75/M2904]|uniref:Uncharacterized protein n=3 Tax=Viannia TaxID=37616 RepID=A4HMP6_LEIBR|nr:conserved hypothetical protein [Leishmania braziliensis MHOM/BR/75/M2904]KAI5689292.1 hypothetical protein MNV84_07441 [Leishmania braziliensis]CAJ2480285.1 unnamed protein product [Leishmania braziliensis]CAJ2480726.1 unnamed protein product [Leishmania braziliensis]CAM43434.1 conserved hypothetical protein [Leishmania braziliensis MHOM/BR/75/M2904]SYZ69507.1 hypothetical_protein [Leishmania braziliensis MHOM/BR/75/M2904]
MLRTCRVFCFRMKCGSMYVDYKIMSRNHRRSIRVEDALVDPLLPTTVVPLHWLEQLRCPSTRLLTGYHIEEAVYAKPNYGDRVSRTPALSSSSLAAAKPEESDAHVNAIRAGPVVLYITGQSIPVVLNPLFVHSGEWGLTQSNGELDLRIGMDAIEQCSLYAELRPGGLLYSKLPHPSLTEAMEPVQDTLKRYGMKCGLAESPLVPRPWTHMRYMFIDELQRGPKMTEFVGYNPRSGTQWRFSQHTKYFRTGIWRETIRRNEMNDGLHAHSSWQKSPQQAVPEISFLAPYP